MGEGCSRAVCRVLPSLTASRTSLVVRETDDTFEPAEWSRSRSITSTRLCCRVGDRHAHHISGDGGLVSVITVCSFFLRTTRRFIPFLRLRLLVLSLLLSLSLSQSPSAASTQRTPDRTVCLSSRPPVISTRSFAFAVQQQDSKRRTAEPGGCLQLAMASLLSCLRPTWTPRSTDGLD